MEGVAGRTRPSSTREPETKRSRDQCDRRVAGVSREASAFCRHVGDRRAPVGGELTGNRPALLGKAICADPSLQSRTKTPSPSRGDVRLRPGKYEPP